MVEKFDHKQKNKDSSKQKDWKFSTFLCLEIENKLSFFELVVLPALKNITKTLNDRSESENFIYLSNVIESLIKTNLSNTNEKIYSLPNSMHITTYFRGKGKYDPENQASKEFIEDKEVSITVSGVIVIPKRIITAIVFPVDCFVNNEFPHITSLLGSYKPVDSNTVCSNLFSKGSELHVGYKEKFSSIEDTKCFSVSITPFKFEEKAFICLFGKGKEIILKSHMKARM